MPTSPDWASGSSFHLAQERHVAPGINRKSTSFSQPLSSTQMGAGMSTRDATFDLRPDSGTKTFDSGSGPLQPAQFRPPPTGAFWS